MNQIVNSHPVSHLAESTHYALKRRRAGKRGVSPIIATILLVAITVVLAAVLYVLISGLTGGGVSSPYSLQMTNDGQTVPAAGTYFITLALNPTAGLTTGLFGLKITNVSSATVAGAAVPTTTCKLYATFGSTACPKATAASTAWYVVLVAENGTVANSVRNGGLERAHRGSDRRGDAGCRHGCDHHGDRRPHDGLLDRLGVGEWLGGPVDRGGTSNRTTRIEPRETGARSQSEPFPPTLFLSNSGESRALLPARTRRNYRPHARSVGALDGSHKNA